MSARWQNRREMPSHADDWLMTYADMITLLLCFFAVFVSVSLTQKHARQHVEVTQTLPLPPTQVTETVPLERVAEKAAPQVPPATAAAVLAPQPEAQPAPASTAPKPEAPPAPKPEPSVAAAAAPEPPAATTEPPQPVPAVAPVVLTLPRPVDPPVGDRIFTLELNSAAFFDSGLATLSPAGEAILRPIAAKLQGDEYRGYRVTVEGHTDDNPIHTAQFPSNWELSTARAAAVAHYLVDQGIPAERLRAAGYADTFPKAPNRDAAGKPIAENQAQNRRVVIRLEKIEKAKPDPTVAITVYPPPELQ